MKSAMFEHVNVTVADPAKTAQWLSKVFGWHIRWQGAAIHGGTTYHVGNDSSYVAIYTKGPDAKRRQDSSHATIGGLNHIGVVVDDLDGTERLVKETGFKTFSHEDYEPGRRFYFHDHDGIEFEVVNYAAKTRVV